MIAAKHAALYLNNRDHRYVLAGPQVKSRRWAGQLLLRSHQLVHRYMEFRTGRALEPKKVTSILETYASLDLRDDLTNITAPVLVVVGRKDRVHYGPASDIEQLVPHSE